MSDSHAIFKNNPKLLIEYLYTKVSIATADNSMHEGWVYTVDPVSESVVLVLFDEDEVKRLEVVVGKSIQKINIVDDNKERHRKTLDRLFRQPEEGRVLSSDEMSRRKESLKTWLSKNRLPIEETDDGTLILSDVLQIIPPYDVKNCFSTNEIVLAKIQNLIETVPEDIDE